MSHVLVTLADSLLGPHWRLKEQIRATMFDKQLELHDDPAQFKATPTGRRGGKSDGMPKSSALDVLDAGFNEAVLIGAETLKKSVSLHWQNIAKLTAEHQLPLTPKVGEGAWVTPWGARIQFWGMHDKGAVELIRGFKLKAARFDEVATYAGLLPRLVEHVLEPALGDTMGQCTLYGTPSVTRSGPWFEICEGTEAAKWAVKRWDVRDNPHFWVGKGGGAAWLQTILTRNKWTWQNPTFQREYLGIFTNDTDSIVVQYDARRDDLATMPDGYSLAWKHVVGVDYGYNDAFAIVVLAVDPYSLTKVVAHADKAAHLTYDAAADMLATVLERYGSQLVVCDPAGGGKPFYETFNRRYGEKLGVNVRSAHKVAGSLVESYRFQNTELRGDRLKVLQPAAKQLTDEWLVLPWKDEWRDEPDDAYEQDCTDAARYALMETITWQPKQRPAATTDAEKLERELRKSIERQAAQDRSPMGSLRNRWG